MRRRDFIRTSALFAGAVPMLSFAAERSPAPGQKPSGKTDDGPGVPTVTNPSVDSVSVVWGVSGSSTGHIEYGDTPALGRKEYGMVDGLFPFDDTVLTVRLRRLKPGTKVYYRTVTRPARYAAGYKITQGEEVRSQVYSFTLPGAGDTARIVVWNDTHQQHDTIAALGDATARIDPGLLVFNGDIVHSQFSKKENLSDCFLNFGHSRPGWSDRVLAFVRGNHDVAGAVCREVVRYAPRDGDEGHRNLLRIGPVGILLMDTAGWMDLSDFDAYREQQRVWLTEAVKDPRFAGAPFRVVFCHIPLRWKNPKRERDWCPDSDSRWSPVFAESGVQAVISGHTHEFWHDAPKPARPYHQIVSGGPKLKADGWSPTPACMVTLDATKAGLLISVTEVLSGKNHLTLTLAPAK